MQIGGRHYRTIWRDADGATVWVIDQTKLPFRFETCALASLGAAARAISEMIVRGAPLIGVTGAYGLALAAREDAGDAALRSWDAPRHAADRDQSEMGARPCARKASRRAEG
jgi:methylthioribose-1-phosphate isomerase